jgi:hypothetical protein
MLSTTAQRASVLQGRARIGAAPVNAQLGPATRAPALNSGTCRRPSASGGGAFAMPQIAARSVRGPEPARFKNSDAVEVESDGLVLPLGYHQASEAEQGHGTHAALHRPWCCCSDGAA